MGSMTLTNTSSKDFANKAYEQGQEALGAGKEKLDALVAEAQKSGGEHGFLAQAQEKVDEFFHSGKESVGHDAGRKPISEQVEEKITPDSAKSDLDKAKETVTNNVDKAASELYSDKDKNIGQRAFDTVRREADK